MTGHTMPAKYAGRCPQGCGRRIRKRDPITLHRGRTFCPACWLELTRP